MSVYVCLRPRLRVRVCARARARVHTGWCSAAYHAACTSLSTRSASMSAVSIASDVGSGAPRTPKHRNGRTCTWNGEEGR
eukprot:6181458-Pleurochrysis_carterae.AAC.1